MKEKMGARLWLAALMSLYSAVSFGQTSGVAAQTPEELVSAYDSLASGILALKSTERDMVRSILVTTYTHARATLTGAKSKIQAGEAAQAEIEKLAALVSQLGNEGDAAVAGIRKRLVEGGHHHNAAGEQQGVYDPGFVIVTRAAKKVFLDAATEMGKLATSPDATALDAQWRKVQNEFEALMKAVQG